MTDSYENKTSQRLLKLVEMMAGHEVEGIRPADLAKAVGAKPPTITRDLANLELAGWAQRVDGSTSWRLTPRVGQISTTIQTNLIKARARVTEAEQRYSRHI